MLSKNLGASERIPKRGLPQWDRGSVVLPWWIDCKRREDSGSSVQANRLDERQAIKRTLASRNYPTPGKD